MDRQGDTPPGVTLLIQRSQGSPPIRFAVSRAWGWAIGTLLLLVIAGGIAAVVAYRSAMDRMGRYATLAAEIQTLQRQNQAMWELERELAELRELQARMLSLAGIEPALGSPDQFMEELPHDPSAEESDEAAGRALVFWPLAGAVQGDFSEDHPGLDMAAPARHTVVAAGDGVVVDEGEFGGIGLRLVVEHRDSLQTVYGNNELNLVAPGDIVEAGQVIALVGSGPEEGDPHLHFEVWKAGQPVDPRTVIGLAPSDEDGASPAP